MNPFQIKNIPDKPSADAPRFALASLPDDFATELNRVISLINDEHYQCHVLSAETFAQEQTDTFLRRKLQLDSSAQARLCISEVVKSIPAAGTVLSLPDFCGQKHIIIFIKEQTDAFELWRLLTGALQEKWHYAEYFQQAEQDYWNFRRQGHSAEKTEALMKATHFNYEKINKISNTYKNIQANVIAAAVIILKALPKHPFEQVSQIKERLLTDSAQRSNDLFLPEKGITGLDFPICKDILEQILGGSHIAYVQKDGLIDWQKLYKQTLTAVKNIGYTPHAIIDADKNECRLLQMMQKQYPRRQTLLNMLQWTKAYHGSKILQDFTQAQKFYLSKAKAF